MSERIDETTTGVTVSKEADHPAGSEKLLCDLQGKILKINGKFKELTGCSESDVLNLPFANFIAVEDRCKFRECINNVDSISESRQISLKLIGRDHHYSSFQVIVFLERNEENEPVISLDITQELDFDDKWKINFQALFNQPAIGMIIATPEGTFLDVNDRFAKMLGYKSYEMAGMNFREITHPDDLERDEQLNKEMQTGARDYFEFEKRYFHKSGKTVWVKLFSNMIKDEKGQALYGLVSVVNINAQKKIQQRLNIANEELLEKNAVLKTEYEIIDLVLKRLEDAERLGNFGTFEFDILKNCGWWSDNQYAIHGFETDEVTPSYAIHLECVHPQDRERIKQNYSSIINGNNESGKMDYKLIDNQGNLKHIHSEYAVEKDQKGHAVKIFGIDQDVTLQSIYTSKLSESEKRFRMLSDISPNIILLHDLEGKISYMNKKGCSVFGFSRDFIIGKTVEIILSRESSDKQKKLLSEIIKNNDMNLHNSILTVNDANNEQRVIQNFAQPIVKDGKISEMMIVASDITELKNREKELEAHKEHLEELVKQRTSKLEMQKTDLEEMNKLFVGREFRIKELRDEVKELKKRLADAGL